MQWSVICSRCSALCTKCLSTGHFYISIRPKMAHSSIRRTCLVLVWMALSFIEMDALPSQYMDNNEQYMAPYARHNQMASHRQQGANLIKTIQPNDDLTSQSLFMMDFKRQAIVMQEPSEKNSSKYILTCLTVGPSESFRGNS